VCLFLTCTASLAATACGSEKRGPGGGVTAGDAGAQSTAGAGFSGGAAGESSGGAGATSGVGGAAGGLGGAGGTSIEIDFSQHRLYQHLIEPFHTLEECLAAQNPDFFVNCYQEVDFCPDGSAIIIVTDIQEPGSYVVGDGVIETYWPDAVEAPAELGFKPVSPQHLVDDIKNWDWLLAEDERITYCP